MCVFYDEGVVRFACTENTMPYWETQPSSALQICRCSETENCRSLPKCVHCTTTVNSGYCEPPTKQTRNIFITFIQRCPPPQTSSTLAQHCINVIQMFGVCWLGVLTKNGHPQNCPWMKGWYLLFSEMVRQNIIIRWVNLDKFGRNGSNKITWICILICGNTPRRWLI